MTKITKAAPSAVEAAEALVATREDELAVAQGDLAAAEAALPDLAESDDDNAFESASLGVARLCRSELRAQKRLEQAQEALAEAKEAEEADRRRGIFETGRKAAAEAGRLADIYAGHASEIAKTLRAIEALREPIEAANKSLPEGERRIDLYALKIQCLVELPAATEGGDKFWWRPDGYGFTPLNPPPPRRAYILVDGALVPFDASDPAHLAARDAPKPIEAVAQPVAQRPTPPQPKYGETTSANGRRAFKAPPCEWPPRPEAN